MVLRLATVTTLLLAALSETHPTAPIGHVLHEARQVSTRSRSLEGTLPNLTCFSSLAKGQVSDEILHEFVASIRSEHIAPSTV